MTIDLYPTISQKDLIDRCIEGYIMTYNWALQCEKDNLSLYRSGLSPYKFLHFYILQDMFKYFRNNTPFLQSLPTHSMINAIRDMIYGYDMFFRKIDGKNPPYQFKDNFFGAFSSYKPRSEPKIFYFEDNYLRIEGLPPGELIKTSYHTYLSSKDRLKFKYIDPIIYRNNYTGKYFLRYVVLKNKLSNELINTPVSEPIGVDVNKVQTYACSNGLIIPYSDTTREEKHLHDINQKISWDRNKCKETGQPLSNSAKYRLEERRKIYAHISNKHKDTCYKGALEIIRYNPEAIILETLHLRSIMGVPYVADDLQFHPLGIAQQILEEQAYKYDIPVYYAPEHFHSSSICSKCGSYKDIKMNRLFRCDVCGLVLDRDINAAINLKNWYMQNKDTL